MGRKNHIPDGWRDIQPIGQPIPGTRFIAFKVPLKGVLTTKKFTPKDLNAALKALNVKLGLIIDLTNTAKYNYAKDLPKSVEYKKLVTVGHKVPDDATILQFKKWVRKFLWENAENEKLIGVNCTYGINRTGYLICRYLIDVEGWDPITAIQAFGEARGHHMNGSVYLTDLQTQPVRSNIGMNVWDAGDAVPPPNDTAGHTDRTSNEEHPRPAKRLRVNDDGHNDIPEQIQLKEFDFINKGPGQRRKPYYNQHFQDDPEPLEETRQSHFADHQFSDDHQKEIQLKDLDFATGSGQRLQPCHDHHLCDDFPESAQPEHINMDHGQRQKHFPDFPPQSDILIDSQVNRSHEKRQRLFHDPQSNNEYQSQMLLKKLGLHNKRPEQGIRTFQDYSPHDDIQTPVEDLKFFRRDREQQMVPLTDNHHHNDLQREIPVEDFDNRDSESRCRLFHESQSYDDFSKQVQLKDFLNTKQKMRLFGDHSPRDNIQYEGYVERSTSQKLLYLTEITVQMRKTTTEVAGLIAMRIMGESVLQMKLSEEKK
ncbi:uncharacterized protein LOC121926351 isoform X2 [Sceloporus undulatus]|uniref:uncharacterized protein LOC121926351 isoform X2 n=1 Tax=Sceloporus undulatus TaxID=8520 RepID=UPI001C4BB4D2|nr:uncharacterized protein LOC121926351 isoform X2 [Sceloporus undulatus]